MDAAKPIQMSCRFVRLRKTLFFTLDRSFGIVTYAILHHDSQTRRRDTAFVCCLSFPRIFPVLVTAEDLFGQTSRFHQAEAQDHGIRCNADQRGVHIAGNPHRRNQCCVNRHTDHHQECLKCKGEQPSEIIGSYITPFTVAHRCERDRGKRCIE